MKRFEVIKFVENLNKIDIQDFNKFLVYAIRITKSKMLKILEEAQEKEKELYTKEFISAENSRISILRKFAEKDETGDPMIIDGEFLIYNTKDCKKEVQDNYEKNKEAIDRFVEDSKVYDSYMNEEIGDPIVKTSFTNIPETIKDNFTDEILRKFVKESEEELEKLI